MMPGTGLAYNGTGNPEPVAMPHESLFAPLRTREKQLRDLRRELTAQRSVNETQTARIADLEGQLRRSIASANSWRNIATERLQKLEEARRHPFGKIEPLEMKVNFRGVMDSFHAAEKVLDKLRQANDRGLR